MFADEWCDSYRWHVIATSTSQVAKDWLLVTRNPDCQNDNYKWENCQLGLSVSHWDRFANEIQRFPGFPVCVHNILIKETNKKENQKSSLGGKSETRSGTYPITNFCFFSCTAPLLKLPVTSWDSHYPKFLLIFPRHLRCMYSNKAQILSRLSLPSAVILSTDHELPPARNVIDVQAQDFVVNDVLLLPILQAFAQFIRSLHVIRNAWCFQPVCSSRILCRFYSSVLVWTYS